MMVGSGGTTERVFALSKLAPIAERISDRLKVLGVARTVDHPQVRVAGPQLRRVSRQRPARQSS